LILEIYSRVAALSNAKVVATGKRTSAAGFRDRVARSSFSSRPRTSHDNFHKSFSSCALQHLTQRGVTWD